MKKFWLLIIFIITAIFFYPLFLKGKIPVPSDSLVGMYHPFRDYFGQDYPQGIPYKNFLITDPVRQIIPWKKLSMDILKKGKLPLWNPYSFSGTPLLANFQSSSFYPLNIILLFNFKTTWSLFIYLQVLLGSIFMYLFLRSLALKKIPGLIASLSWVFSGFFIAWMEWGTIVHTALWLPLIMLSINKIIKHVKNNENRKLLLWLSVLTVSLLFSFFAGHIQTFFYISIISFIYFIWHFWSVKKQKAKLILCSLASLFIFIIVSSIQWFPFLQFLGNTARGTDVINILSRNDWFLPWQNLIGFIFPDFFGNPTTLNYWGIWNYGEFALYIGVINLLFAINGIIKFKHNKYIKLFSILLIIFFGLALPTPLAKIPYLLKIPWISTMQPSRIIFLIDFCLIILTAFGLNYFWDNLIKENKLSKSILSVIFGLVLIFISCWLFVALGFQLLSSSAWMDNLIISRRNMIYPSVIFFTFSIFMILLSKIRIKFNKKSVLGIFIIIALLNFLDLFRFFHKFDPFTDKSIFFSNTKTIDFLRSDNSSFRVLSADNQIFPGNISSFYKLQFINGYDPLYLESYAQYIKALDEESSVIKPPYGFNRIIDPNNTDSRLLDLLNVKYVLSFNDLNNEKYTKVFEEGKTKIFENREFLPRAFLADNIKIVENKQDALENLLSNNIDLRQTALVFQEDSSKIEVNQADFAEYPGQVNITSFTENEIVLDIQAEKDSILVLNQIYYPAWHAVIDGKETNIIPVDFLLSGLEVPSGNHQVKFTINLFNK